MSHSFSEADAERIVRQPKRLIRDMAWSRKLTRSNPQWMLYQTPIEVDGRVPEGWYVIAQWRPAAGIAPEKYSFILLIEGARLYAIDVDPLGEHQNKIGRGRPYFGRIIEGPHEHLWCDEGEGYVEPFDLSGASMDAIWELFCRRANLSPAGPFKDPDSKRGRGQMGLDL